MSSKIRNTKISSPLGVLEAETVNEKLTRLSFINEQSTKKVRAISSSDDMPVSQLKHYFRKKQTGFNLSFELRGTDFQKRVWEQLLKIPFGATATYGKIAEKLGDSNKMRAVGNAVGANPIPIIIPCHRVVGADNILTGYSGGLWRKKWLLKHEGITLF